MGNLFEIKMLKAPAILLSLLGETQQGTSKRLAIFRIITCSVLTLVLTCSSINLFLVEGEILLETLQSCCHELHTLLKYTCLIIYKSEILAVLHGIKNKFWNYAEFKDLKEVVQMICKVIENTQRTMLVLPFFLGWGYLCLFVLDSSHTFPFVTYVPESAAAGAVLWLCHAHVLYIGCTIVFGYDLIYFSLCVHTVLQLRLLKEKIKCILNKGHKNGTKELSDCIKHHHFLFLMFLRMKRIYSMMLLVQYFLTLISSCSVLIEVVAGHSGLGNHLVKSVAVLFLFIEFAFYTLPAEQVSFEFSDISDSIYTSKWYMNAVPVQKLMLFMMLKSQRVHYFSGAGFIDINVDAFGSVLRKTFSFYTIMRNLLNTQM